MIRAPRVAAPAALGRLRLLNVRYLTAHRLRSGISVAAVALCVAMVSGLLATYGSIAASVARFGGQLAGDAELEVSGLTDGGFDEALLAGITADPDVAQAVPMIRTIVNIGDHRVVLLGVDQRITSLRSSLLRTVDELPSAARLSIYSVTRADRNELVAGPQLAATLGLAPGQEVAVTGSLGRTTAVTVFSTVAAGQAGVLNGGYWAIANLRTAQRLTGRSARIDSILVVPRPGSDRARLRQRLLTAVDHRAVVAAPQFRVAQASEATSLMRNMTLFVAAIALTVAGFLIFNTFSMAAVERQEELATVRALGGRRRRLMRDFIFEAGLLGLAGCALGLPLGALLGHTAITSLPPFLTESFDVRIEFAFPAYVVVVGLGCGVACAVLGAAGAARRVLRIRPMDALRDAGAPAPASPRTRFVLPVAAALAVLLGLAALRLPDQGALLAAPLVLAGVLAGSAALVVPLSRWIAWLTGRAGAAGLLAGVAVTRSPRRAWATVMTVAVTFAIGVATYGAVRDVVTVVSAPSLGRTDFYVKPTPPDVLPTDPVLPTGLAARVAAVPGVREVVECQAAYANLGEKRVILAGVTGGNAPAFQRARPAARAAVLAGTGAIISRGLARSLGLRVGGELRLPTAQGERRLPVVDVVDFVSLDSGMVVISLDQLRQWYQRDGATWLEVQLDPGADRAAVRAGLEHAGSGYPTRIYVVSGAEEMRGGEQAAQQAGALALVIQWMVTVAAMLTLLNTLLLSVLERRRELAVLRAVGASRRFMRRMVLIEGAGLAVVGAAAGLGLGLPLQYLVTVGLSRSAAVQVPYRPAAVSLLLALVAFAVAMLAPVVPLRQAGRINPALALNER